MINDTLVKPSPDGFVELFRVKARPTRHQPGNAIVSKRPRGKNTFKRGGAKSYQELNGTLEAFYDIVAKDRRLVDSDVQSFAYDIMQLFQYNKPMVQLPEASIEAYMILLFEIARRLVKSENSKKQKFDDLPIGSAIARLIQLLVCEKETCNFKDVFIPGGKFHCFTGTPEERREAIDNINKVFNNTIRKAVTEEDHHKELQEMYKCIVPISYKQCLRK